jgi:tartrate dehydrogenase/decarboxylase / D-malate dehydrogenase
MQAFVEIAVEVAQGFRDVGSEKMLVDAMTARMTLKRGAPDTIVTTNLHADAVIAALRKSGRQSS